MENIEPGYLICCEGIDGCGKTTAAHMLHIKLEEMGKRVEKVNILQGDPVSAKIRTILTSKENEIHNDAEFYLYAAAVLNTYHQVIVPLLAQGITVICDRSHLSTWAYQVYPRISEGEWHLADLFKQVYEPIKIDSTVILLTDVEKAMTRVKTRDGRLDRIESRGHDYMHSVQKAYMTIAREDVDTQQVDSYVNNGSLEELEVFVDSVIAKLF